MFVTDVVEYLEHPRCSNNGDQYDYPVHHREREVPQVGRPETRELGTKMICSLVSVTVPAKIPHLCLSPRNIQRA